MADINDKTAANKEWEALCRKEQKLLERHVNKKDSAVNELLEKKVPEKLRIALDKAFEKGFRLVFEKGSGLIEKTYNKEDLKKEFRVNLYADKISGDKKSLRRFSKTANTNSRVNLAVSGISGVGMGLFGVGLPDIPIFIGMIMRSLYEMSINYGFDYASEKEKYFMLLLIEGAVSYGDHSAETDAKVEEYIRSNSLPEKYDLDAQIVSASGVLSKELLYMKFLQGIPVIGVVGGAYDAVYMKKILEYAKLKYKKRFLIKYKKV